jgi:hypothetical protein
LQGIWTEGSYREVVVSGGGDEQKHIREQRKNQVFNTSKDEIGWMTGR